MSNDVRKQDNIELSIPSNPVYLNTVRNTAYSIAEKMNFSNAKAEEIKTAVSETAFVIMKSTLGTADAGKNFSIKFKPENDNLKVEFNTGTNKGVNYDPVSMGVIKSCMDNFDVSYSKNSCSISMTKNL